MVPSADWWVPSPNIKQNTGQAVNHAADLKVRVRVRVRVRVTLG